MPVKWHVTMNSDEAVLDYTAQAYARAYYVWDYLNNGIITLYWQMADANGVFIPREGDERKLDMTYLGHTKRPWLQFGRNESSKQ